MQDWEGIEAISIHAPREGSDCGTLYSVFSAQYISIHAPREGSDGRHRRRNITQRAFLSTLPARGATVDGRNVGKVPLISIHAPREGSDGSAV